MLSLQALLLLLTPALGLPTIGVNAPAVEIDGVMKRASAPKTMISVNNFNEIVWYAAYPVSAGKPCTKPPAGISQLAYINNAQSDTQAALFRDDNRKEFVLAIPGSASDKDWATNLDFSTINYVATGATCQGCKVHRGFLGAWNSISADVEKAIKAAIASNPAYSVVISGHSLGGALAELAFGSFKTQPALKISKLFTYGAPRVGDVKFANYRDGLAGATEAAEGIARRVTHADDPIPHIPLKKLGSWEYAHPRTEYWQSTQDVTLALTYRCFGQDPTDCHLSTVLNFQSKAHTTYAGMKNFCT